MGKFVMEITGLNQFSIKIDNIKSIEDVKTTDKRTGAEITVPQEVIKPHINITYDGLNEKSNSVVIVKNSYDENTVAKALDTLLTVMEQI